MTKSRRIHYSTLLLVFSALSAALEVAPNSPCWPKCLDDPKNGDPANRDHSLTFHPDLSCFDADYKGDKATDVGKKFADCQACMKDSGYEDNEFGERDTGWFLFNNRATVDWCLFGRFAEEKNDNVADTVPYKQCNSACNSIFESIDYRVKSDPRNYEFCDYNGNFTSDADKCISCLYNADNLTILGNILTTTKEMCKQKPGKIFDFDANVYTASRIQLSSISTPSNSPTAAPSSTAVPTSSPRSDTPSAGISKGALAGIVLGALVGVALILGGILLFLRRLRNKRNIIQMPKGDDMHGHTPGMMAGNYQYDRVPQSGQDKYAYQSTPMGGHTYGTEPVQTEPIELTGQGVVNELPTQPNSPLSRR